MFNFGLGIAASLIAAIIYLVVFSSNESRILGWFGNASNSIIRRWYVAAVISAVNGDALRSDSRVLSTILTFCFIGVLVLLSFGRAHSVSVRDAAIEALGSIDGSIDGSVNPPNETQNVAERLFEIINYTSSAAMYFSIFWWCLLATVVFNQAIYQPYMMLRWDMTNRYRRVRRLLELLANPDEIRELYIAEFNLCDEKSLHKLYTELERISRKYDVTECLDKLRLGNFFSETHP